MKVNENLHVLPLSAEIGGQPSTLNLSLILDETNGHTLVDAGLPGHEDEIRDALREAGLGVGDLGRIILTHQDLDHVGSLHALAEESGASVVAHEEDIPYIDGSLRQIKLTPEVLEQSPEMRQAYESLETHPVDSALRDEDRLDLAGGTLVVFTPGHTPGHVSLYLEQSRTLIAGDALSAEDGRLAGPPPQMTPDMETAEDSIQKLAELDVQTIVCYHGGLVTEDAEAQLRSLAH